MPRTYSGDSYDKWRPLASPSAWVPVPTGGPSSPSACSAEEAVPPALTLTVHLGAPLGAPHNPRTAQDGHLYPLEADSEAEAPKFGPAQEGTVLRACGTGTSARASGFPPADGRAQPREPVESSAPEAPSEWAGGGA